MTAARVEVDAMTVSAIAAVNSFGEFVTGSLVAIAPAAGMLPSAYVTWRHMVDALHIDPVIAGFLSFGVDALGIGLSFRRASLDRLHLTQHMRKLTVALYAYFGVVTVGNICVSIRSAGDWSAIVFESALALLPLPVALLMAVNAEVDAVKMDADNATARDVADKARASADRIADEQRAQNNLIELKRLDNEATANLKRFEADIAREKRAERAAIVSVAKEAPAVVIAMPPAKVKAALEPCRNGCPKMVAGTNGQNAHNDKCPNRKTGAEVGTK